MTNGSIDHVAEAIGLRNLATDTSHTESAANLIAAAHVHATLAMVERQDTALQVMTAEYRAAVEAEVRAQQDAVLQAMSEYAQTVAQINLDGSTECNIIENWVAELREPHPEHDLDWHRYNLGIEHTPKER